MIGIIDYGAGNLRSVQNAFEKVGAPYELVQEAAGLRRASKLVLPGVGHFGAMMHALDALGVREAIKTRINEGVPFLGVCLGMQALYAGSEEAPQAEGLGVFSGRAERFSDAARVPHMGWNRVSWRHDEGLAAGLPDPCAFYHVHSFAPKPLEDSDVAGTATYGGEFASVVALPPVFGTQFHPEKSGPHGLALLRNFATVCTRAAA